jgi:aryl-alcohol dehydrogenase-like predicted oxidoreductase
MKYHILPRTDLNVSQIGLGTMTFGEQNTLEQAFEQMDVAVDMGVNFFDCAEMYPVPGKIETQGRTEEYIGEWMKDRKSREKIVLATKVTGPSGMYWIREKARLNRIQIRQAIEGNLKRLGTDYIDIYQLHWPDRQSNFFGKLDFQIPQDEEMTPLIESILAMDELVKEGKIRYIGISNESPWGLMTYLNLAREHNLNSVISIQNPYNLLNRMFDVGLAEACFRENVSLLAYSPLAFGILSGKYLRGERPKGSRMALFGDKLGRYLNGRAELATENYVKLARRHDLDPAQMALAWVNQRPLCKVNIIGATTIDQLKANINSIELSLSKEILDGIENIHRQNPNPAP